MDHRELLMKYISHVGDCEGVTYLSDWSLHFNPRLFSAEETEELRRLEDESKKFDNLKGEPRA